MGAIIAPCDNPRDLVPGSFRLAECRLAFDGGRLGGKFTHAEVARAGQRAVARGTRKFDVGVFTQPGPISDMSGPFCCDAKAQFYHCARVSWKKPKLASGSRGSHVAAQRKERKKLVERC